MFDDAAAGAPLWATPWPRVVTHALVVQRTALLLEVIAARLQAGGVDPTRYGALARGLIAALGVLSAGCGDGAPDGEPASPATLFDTAGLLEAMFAALPEVAAVWRLVAPFLSLDPAVPESTLDEIAALAPVMAARVAAANAALATLMQIYRGPPGVVGVVIPDGGIAG